MAASPTVYIIASDQARNGKTLLARCVADYLMLDGRDPFLIDTASPLGDLRNFFPGRTQLVDFSKVQGQIRIFDAILGSPGRDYVIDLTVNSFGPFFAEVNKLEFLTEARKFGFRFILLFIVDAAEQSATVMRGFVERDQFDFSVPVRNAFVGSSWPAHEVAMTIPALDNDVMQSVAARRFSLRTFVLGDTQNLNDRQISALNRFVYDMMQGLNNIEPAISLKGLL